MSKKNNCEKCGRPFTTIVPFAIRSEQDWICTVCDNEYKLSKLQSELTELREHFKASAIRELNLRKQLVALNEDYDTVLIQRTELHEQLKDETGRSAGLQGEVAGMKDRMKSLENQERYWRYDVVATQLCPIDHTKPFISHDCVGKIEALFAETAALKSKLDEAVRALENISLMCARNDWGNAVEIAEETIQKIRGSEEGR